VEGISKRRIRGIKPPTNPNLVEKGLPSQITPKKVFTKRIIKIKVKGEFLLLG